MNNPALDITTAERFARLALACVHREYPNKIAHVMNSDGDARPPRALTPAFYGCFDWHSAVHGHWLLVRLTRLFPQAPWTAETRAALAQSLSAENIAGEVSYLSGPEREGFERPYGLAWLLQLSAELREWDDDADGRTWLHNLRPLEDVAAEHLRTWLSKLSYPIRSGEHSQTAFAMGLALDWARTATDRDFEALLVSRTLDFYHEDRNGPLAYEPSGHDFLSPCLAEADLVRRVMPPAGFVTWLTAFLPDLAPNANAEWLPPVTATDPSDGKLAHLDGLNLSRAWMLEGIAAGLPANDSRVALLKATAAAHAQAGLAAVTGEHYAGGHWLASFAVYLTTRRGVG